MREDEVQDTSGDTTTPQFFGFILRISWMFVGPVVFAMLGASAVLNGIEPTSRTTGLLALLAVAMAIARYLDVAWMHGRNADGEPATMRDAKRYAWIVLLCGAAAIGLGIASMQFRDSPRPESRAEVNNVGYDNLC